MGFESVATGAALILQELVVKSEAADEYTDFSAGQRLRGYPAILQRLPRGLQHQPLLRIEQVRLARRDTEKLRVELVDFVEKPASASDHLADFCRIRVVVFRSVPPCFGNYAGGVRSTAQQLPIIFRGVGSAWEAAPNSDYRQGLSSALLGAHALPFPLGTARRVPPDGCQEFVW